MNISGMACAAFPLDHWYLLNQFHLQLKGNQLGSTSERAQCRQLGTISDATVSLTAAVQRHAEHTSILRHLAHGEQVEQLGSADKTAKSNASAVYKHFAQIPTMQPGSANQKLHCWDRHWAGIATCRQQP